MFCKYCGNEIRDNEQYCSNCGRLINPKDSFDSAQTMPGFCKSCGYKTNKGAQYCRKCGARIVPMRPVPQKTSIELMTGVEFEHFCKRVLLANGFYDVETTSASHDYGGDLLAKKDHVSYVFQCKKYSSSVGIDAVQQVIGSRSIYNCHVAVVLTNSTFTGSAIKLAEKNNVLLWDGVYLQKLINLMQNIQGLSQSMNNALGYKQELRLPNGDKLSIVGYEELKSVYVESVSKKNANLALAVLLLIADKYDTTALQIIVSFNDQARTIVSAADLNGEEINKCEWEGTISTPISKEDEENSKAIVAFVVDSLKLSRKEEEENGVYCHYNYKFKSNCLFMQRLDKNPDLAFYTVFNTMTTSEAIAAWVFYCVIFSKHISSLKYPFTFWIVSEDSKLLVKKDNEGEEMVCYFDRKNKPTPREPSWMVKDYSPSEEKTALLNVYSCCFIEFINKTNLYQLV